MDSRYSPKLRINRVLSCKRLNKTAVRVYSDQCQSSLSHVKRPKKRKTSAKPTSSTMPSWAWLLKASSSPSPNKNTYTCTSSRKTYKKSPKMTIPSSHALPSQIPDAATKNSSEKPQGQSSYPSKQPNPMISSKIRRMKSMVWLIRGTCLFKVRGKECRSALWWSIRNRGARWEVLGVMRWLRRLSRRNSLKSKWLLRRLRSDRNRKVSARDPRRSSTSSIWAIRNPVFAVGERFSKTYSRQTRKRGRSMPWSVKGCCSTKVARRLPSWRTLTVSAVNYSLASENEKSRQAFGVKELWCKQTMYTKWINYR